jgi:hypothetical protein
MEPSDPCLIQWNLQTPVSSNGTFRPPAQFTEPSDPCLSLRNLQTPVSEYETFRPLSQLRNLQTPVSVYETFRSLPQSTKPSDTYLIQWKLHKRLLSQPTLLSDPCLSPHCKKRLAIFSSRPGIVQLFPARENLVSDIQAGDRKIDNLFFSVLNLSDQKYSTSSALSFPIVYSGHVPRYPSCSLIGNEKIQESDLLYPAPNGPSHKICGPCFSNKSD